MNKEIKVKAKEIINNIYQPLGHLHCMVGSDTMWEYAKGRAKEHVDNIIEVIPMYTGNLNPKWKYWNDIRNELNTMP